LDEPAQPYCFLRHNQQVSKKAHRIAHFWAILLWKVIESPIFGQSRQIRVNIGSKIPHQFAHLVTICESQSNQRRPNLTWDLCFAFIDWMVLVNNLLQ
jgi:hypothetical protein